MTAVPPPLSKAASPPDDEPGDTDLAQRWQGGDPQAADCLIRRHLPRLHAFMITRATSAAEAEDLTQEVFIAVSRKIDSYRAEVPFAAWLYAIARNKVADAWRRHHHTESFEPHHGGVDGQTPAQVHASEDRARHLWAQAFAILPESQATALWLRVQEDLSMEGIAAALSITAGNAKILLFRARQTLAQRWQSTEVL